MPKTELTSRAAATAHPTARAPRTRASRDRRVAESSSAIGPAPDGDDLTFSIACWLAPRALTGVPHEVTIHRDWSITMPHNLEAEQVAMAFGGYTSCVPLAEVTVHALRKATPSIARQPAVAPRRFGKRMWRLPPAVQVAKCCENQSFTNLAEATSHAYQVSHLSRVWNAPVWQLREVMAIAASRWQSWNRERALTLGADRHVREVDGVDDLWQFGISADEIVRLAEVARAVTEPLPVDFFVGAHYGKADLAWVQSVVESRPDPDFATWVVGLDPPANPIDETRWLAWLQLGLPRDRVRFAVEHGGPPEVVVQISEATGWPPVAAARAWLSWVRVGCQPTPAHFAIIASRGMADAVPSAAAIDRLGSMISDRVHSSEPLTDERRVELAVMLALLGTAAEVVFELNRGVATADLLHRHGGRFLAPDQPHTNA